VCAAERRTDAAEEGVSVSMWLAGAAEAKARRRRFREALDSLAAEHGALSDVDIDRLIGEARGGSIVVGLGAAQPA
jgi:hypothetical protein